MLPALPLTQGGGIRVRRLLLDEASSHHLLLHTGQLEALTCPTTIVHRCGWLPGVYAGRPRAALGRAQAVTCAA